MDKSPTKIYRIASLAISKGIEPQEAARLEIILQESKYAISDKENTAVKYSACCL